MTYQKLFLLNAPVLTSFGEFCYEHLTRAEAQELVRGFIESGRPVESAIGHDSTAEVISEMLGHTVTVNRIEIRQTSEVAVLVFRLRGRIAEGKVLDRDEIERAGYEFCMLTKKPLS